MKTYNGINVPRTIKTERIISAFANDIVQEKLERYTAIMKEQMLSHEFPPIEGFPTIIDDNEIGGQFLNGEEITEEHRGWLCWKVTDGHHRSLSAIAARVPYLETELDYATITNETDLENFKK